MKKKIKRFWRLLVNRFRCWRNHAVVDHWQEGDIVYVKIQRLGLFKVYAGRTCTATIKIDTTKLA